MTVYGTIWAGDGAYFVSSLSRLESDYNDIHIHLHTSGGSVFDGNLIYNACNKSKNIKKIIVDGIAASMGSIIMIATEKTAIVENGYVMIHAPWSYSGGTAKDKEGQAKLLRMMEQNFIKKFMARTGKTIAEAEKLMDGSDHWFNAQECLEMGLVTEIIPEKVSTPEPVDTQNMDNQEVYNMYASLLTTDISKNKINKHKRSMKQPLISALNLVGVTAESSDTAVVTAVEQHIQNIVQERDNAINALNENLDTQVNAILDQHQEAGSFEESNRDVYAKIGKDSGIAALLTVLGTPKSRQQSSKGPNIKGLIQNTEANARSDWDFKKWQKSDPKGLEEMAENDPAKFNQLFKNQFNK